MKNNWNSRPGTSFVNRPRLKTCPTCGKEFGSQSLRIHIARCRGDPAFVALSVVNEQSDFSRYVKASAQRRRRSMPGFMFSPDDVPTHNNEGDDGEEFVFGARPQTSSFNNNVHHPEKGEGHSYNWNSKTSTNMPAKEPQSSRASNWEKEWKEKFEKVKEKEKERNQERQQRAQRDAQERIRATRENEAQRLKALAEDKQRRRQAYIRAVELYDQRWETFAASPPTRVEFDDIPWLPPLPAVLTHSSDTFLMLGISEAATEREKKMAVRKASLRWHPDKFQQAFGAVLCDGDRGRIMEEVNEVARRVNALKDVLDKRRTT